MLAFQDNAMQHLVMERRFFQKGHPVVKVNLISNGSRLNFHKSSHSPFSSSFTCDNFSAIPIGKPLPKNEDAYRDSGVIFF